ncbi:hypothetical protein NDU88_002391 [Pleurodeles waltl]|uniref:Uncharacterized protein n=1 Tax=Pleurodeles waltl TaxID=8319 RepID=A0AAV7UVG5_PLEWA|nr:hypothetical protein NDU88_002391 [Pleurodeles waltl]
MLGLTAGSRRLFGGPPKWLKCPDLGSFDAGSRYFLVGPPPRQCGTRWAAGSLRGHVACLAVPQRAVITLTSVPESSCCSYALLYCGVASPGRWSPAAAVIRFLVPGGVFAVRRRSCPTDLTLVLAGTR